MIPCFWVQGYQISSAVKYEAWRSIFSTSKSFQPSIDVILYIVASVTTQFLDAFLESICSRTVVVLSLTFSFMRFCPGNYGNAPNLLLQFCTLQFLKVMQVRLRFQSFFRSTEDGTDFYIICFHSSAR